MEYAIFARQHAFRSLTFECFQLPSVERSGTPMSGSIWNAAERLSEKDDRVVRHEKRGTVILSKCMEFVELWVKD